LVTPANGSAYELRGDQVRREFPIIAYAQKQLSVVGTLPDEVRRLVTDPVREHVVLIERELAETALPELKLARQHWLRTHQLASHVKDASLQLEDKRLQVQALRSGLSEVSPEDSAILAAHDGYRAEASWIEGVESSIASARNSLLQTANTVTAKLRLHPFLDSWPDQSLLTGTAEAVDTLRTEIETQFQSMLRLLDEFPTTAALKNELVQFKLASVRHEAAYRESLSRAASNERLLSDLKQLEQGISDLERQIKGYNDEIQSLAAAANPNRPDPWVNWVELHQQRRDLLEQQAANTSQQAGNAFRVTVKHCGDVAPIRAKLQMVLSCGKNIRAADEKIQSLSDRVVNSSAPLTEWVTIIDAFRTLAESRGAAVLPSIPVLVAARFSEANLNSLRDGLDLQLLEDIRYTPLSDEIVFEFTFGNDSAGNPRYIPFQDASPGQQATVLLKALLGQEGPPLLIDQPEEDLDNEQVNVIADYIRGTKHHRQLVFVSHNANLVVNGDSELVACFGYRLPSDQTQATILQEGSIDFAPVRELITSVMEGGRLAFELRRQKYKF
jgi:type III restriction enzyme